MGGGAIAPLPPPHGAAPANPIYQPEKAFSFSASHVQPSYWHITYILYYALEIKMMWRKKLQCYKYTMFTSPKQMTHKHVEDNQM